MYLIRRSAKCWKYGLRWRKWDPYSRWFNFVDRIIFRGFQKDLCIQYWSRFHWSEGITEEISRESPFSKAKKVELHSKTTYCVCRTSRTFYWATYQSSGSVKRAICYSKHEKCFSACNRISFYKLFWAKVNFIQFYLQFRLVLTVVRILWENM